MAIRFTEQITLEVICCANCGIYFGMPHEVVGWRRQDGKTFYCPSGHSNVFRETEIQRLEKQLAQEKSAREQAEARARDERLRAQTARTERDFANHSASALKGVVTRTKNRIKNGVCPCCNRHFENLEKHMKGQHPDWKPEEVKA